MSAFRAAAHLARADFFERVRRPSYLVTLGLSAWLGWGVANGTIALRFGDYRGEANSAWIGLQMALATSGFVSLAGFWVVKGSVERDRRTGVGQILAATPLGKLPYLLGKLLSNFLVLASIVGILAAAALLMQLLARDAAPVALGPLLAPFLLIALPAMAATAAFAVLFECVPFLAGGLGNVLWFFAWGILLTFAAVLHVRALDFVGFTLIEEAVVPLVKARFPGYGYGFSLSAGPRTTPAGEFFFGGIDWTSARVAARIAWFPFAAAISAFGALFFDRFDSARAPDTSAGSTSEAVAEAAPRLFTLGERLLPTSRFGTVLLAELRLLLQGRRWWWWAVFLGLLVAQALAPIADARHGLLAFAFLWPVLAWSEMGTRDARHGVAPLLFSSPRPLLLQLPALWLAGALVALAAGSVAGLRMLVSGDFRGVLAFAAGAAFVPALALALGCASGSRRPFEAVYTVLWYVGPVQGRPVRPLDFFGALPENAAAWPFWLAAALLLFVGAAIARARRARG